MISKYSIGLFMALLVCSCAHKSGHGERKSDKKVIGLNNKREIIQPKKDRKDDVSVKRSEHKGDRMEGTEVFRKYNSAVFMVFTSDGRNTYQGSGFFINAHGLAVSNYHVFEGTGMGIEQIKLTGSDVVYKVATVIHKSSDSDFILFKVDCNNTNYIPIANSKPSVGEKVFAIGSPRGLENTFSSGEVSQWRERNLMQISALIDHGSSGGALINEYGEVVGITSGTFYDGSQANLNYAWSIDVVKPYVRMTN